MNKLLIISGVNGFDYLKNSEVIDLESTDSDCDEWTEFPRERIGATGVLLNFTNSVLICGGSYQDQNGTLYSSNECYTLDKYSSTLFSTMAERRSFSASLVTDDNYVWVTGGLDYNDGSPLSSTEYILPNGASITGKYFYTLEA